MERSPHDTAILDVYGTVVADMPAQGVLALRTAIQALLRAGSPDEGVRRAMELFCAEARRRDVRAERVLILLKQTWRSLPEVRRLRRADRDRLLAHLTTLAIRTFYESASPPGRPESDGPRFPR